MTIASGALIVRENSPTHRPGNNKSSHAKDCSVAAKDSKDYHKGNDKCKELDLTNNKAFLTQAKPEVHDSKETSSNNGNETPPPALEENLEQTSVLVSFTSHFNYHGNATKVISLESAHLDQPQQQHVQWRGTFTPVVEEEYVTIECEQNMMGDEISPVTFGTSASEEDSDNQSNIDTDSTMLDVPMSFPSNACNDQVDPETTVLHSNRNTERSAAVATARSPAVSRPVANSTVLATGTFEFGGHDSGNNGGNRETGHNQGAAQSASSSLTDENNHDDDNESDEWYLGQIHGEFLSSYWFRGRD
ncbi:hypothetical protein ACA910_001577 [Epithemia clementina (nom. ined.)]